MPFTPNQLDVNYSIGPIVNASLVMSTKNTGHNLQSNLHRGQPVPKIRIPPPAIQTRTPRLQQTQPKAGADLRDGQQAIEAIESRNLWDTIIRRKKLIGAVAFAVVTIAGTLLGARLKESWQEYSRIKELEEAAKKLAESTPPSITTNEPATLEAEDSQSEQTKGTDVPQSVTQQSKSAYSVDVARQIALLEDRKAILNRQKLNLEQKIQRLRARQAKKDETKSL